MEDIFSLLLRKGLNINFCEIVPDSNPNLRIRTFLTQLIKHVPYSRRRDNFFDFCRSILPSVKYSGENYLNLFSFSSPEEKAANIEMLQLLIFGISSDLFFDFYFEYSKWYSDFYLILIRSLTLEQCISDNLSRQAQVKPNSKRAQFLHHLSYLINNS